jgi:hypothetical protein
MLGKIWPPHMIGKFISVITGNPTIALISGELPSGTLFINEGIVFSFTLQLI